MPLIKLGSSAAHRLRRASSALGSVAAALRGFRDLATIAFLGLLSVLWARVPVSPGADACRSRVCRRLHAIRLSGASGALIRGIAPTSRGAFFLGRRAAPLAAPSGPSGGILSIASETGCSLSGTSAIGTVLALPGAVRGTSVRQCVDCLSANCHRQLCTGLYCVLPLSWSSQAGQTRQGFGTHSARSFCGPGTGTLPCGHVVQSWRGKPVGPSGLLVILAASAPWARSNTRPGHSTSSHENLPSALNSDAPWREICGSLQISRISSSAPQRSCTMS